MGEVAGLEGDRHLVSCAIEWPLPISPIYMCRSKNVVVAVKSWIQTFDVLNRYGEDGVDGSSKEQ